MELERFDIEGLVHFTMPRVADTRGYFTETFHAGKLREHGILEQNWVQDNQSYSKECYTLRGLHFQLPPVAQAKIVRVLAGKIFDVAVDLRRGSSTFGRWTGIELSDDKQNQLYVPTGFAHGFLTLTRDAVVAYKVSAPYSRAHERSCMWNDPALAIRWPLPTATQPVLSAKDENAPKLQDLKKELEESE